jgi:hypothetical protein
MQRTTLTVLLTLSLLLGATGCNKNVPPPTPLSRDQFPAAFDEAFAKAKPDTKGMANEVVASVQTNAFAEAYQKLQLLATVPDLTKKQSSVVGRAMLTVNDLVQQAAAKGDQNAAEAVKIYRATK